MSEETSEVKSDSWKNPFVRAGQDTPAYIKEKTGLYPAVFFRYRRLAPKEIERKHKEFRDSMAPGVDVGKAIEVAQKLVSEQVTSWSFGTFNRELVALLNHPLVLKMFWVVIQTDPTDEIPQEFMQAGESAEEDDAKKSSIGSL